MSRQSSLLTGLAIVLVVALWWLFLYSPGREDLTRLENDIAAEETEHTSLRSRIAALEQVRARAPETEAALATVRGFVPEEPGLPSALRQIEAAADDAGARVEALAATRPALVDEGLGLYQVTLTITVNGSYFQVVDFMRRIEDPTITSRGITVNNINMGTAEYPALTANIVGTMYAVLDAPPDPEAAAAATPDPAASPAPDAAATAQPAADGGDAG